jgi:hypothetical protein
MATGISDSEKAVSLSLSDTAGYRCRLLVMGEKD